MTLRPRHFDLVALFFLLRARDRVGAMVAFEHVVSQPRGKDHCNRLATSHARENDHRGRRGSRRSGAHSRRAAAESARLRPTNQTRATPVHALLARSERELRPFCSTQAPLVTLQSQGAIQAQGRTDWAGPSKRRASFT